MVHRSKDEERLLAAFSQLTDEQQEIVLEAIQIYADNDRRILTHHMPEQKQ